MALHSVSQCLCVRVTGFLQEVPKHCFAFALLLESVGSQLKTCSVMECPFEEKRRKCDQLVPSTFSGVAYSFLALRSLAEKACTLMTYRFLSLIFSKREL